MLKNSYFILFCVLISLCVACGKWEEEPVKSSLQFIHTSPNKGTVDLLIDNKEAATLAYKSSTPYTDVRAGLRNLKWTVSDNNSDVWLDANLYLPENGIYSVFFIDTLLTNGSLISDLLVNKETFPATAADKAQIRFVNLSPDSPVLSLAVQGIDPIEGINFKKISAFVPITMDVDTTKEYTFLLQHKTAQPPKVDILATFKTNLRARKIYTIAAIGLTTPASGSTDKIELSLTEHNQ